MVHLSKNDSTIEPLDKYNQHLIAQVHPPDWVNPTTVDRYDLVVVGAGTAGLVTAAGAAGLGLGLKVALVEKHLMGGDCLNVGCVPSKTLLHAARVAAQVRHSDRFGIHTPSMSVDFEAVMTRLRQLRADISPNDSAQRFQQLGVDVFLGEARFVNKDAIVVDGQTLRFKKGVIATGARAAHPSIPGLAEAHFLTNETVFNLTQLPPRLAVIGGGSIGCELAQAFQRLGAQVTLFHKYDRLLNREDADAAAILQQVFQQEGIQLVLNCQIQQVESTPAGKVLHWLEHGQPHAIAVDEILIGVGRIPNIENLQLEQAGVDYDDRGVQVNDFLQTTNPNIFAAGDICMNAKFTHAADAAARLVIKNALFAPFGLGRSRLSSLLIPHSTYTSPEVAQVGLSETDAKAQGVKVEVIKIPLSSVDRAIIDDETEGFVKILHPKGSDKILGATVVAHHAGDLISEMTTAIRGNVGLSKLSGVIHPYPTQAEAIKKAADAYRRTLLTPRTKNLLSILAKFS